MKTFASEIAQTEELRRLVLAEIKASGVKYRPAKSKQQKPDKTLIGKIFHCPLAQLDCCSVTLEGDVTTLVPHFVSRCCERILEAPETVGIFRLAGSLKRQRAIIARLDKGGELEDDDGVVDVACVLKAFFRDLPEPMIGAGGMQELLVNSMLMLSGERLNRAILNALLLLPPVHLSTLAFFMQFLKKIAQHSAENQMDVRNLATVIMPNLLPIEHHFRERCGHFTRLVEIMIEISDEIGIIPDKIASQLSLDVSKKSKKRRSGSLTRMFNGLRKMVSGSSSENLEKVQVAEAVNTISTTPCLTKSAKKRRVGDVAPLSAKKKKEILSLQPEAGSILPNTPLFKLRKKSRISLGMGRKISAKLLPSETVPAPTPLERRWSFVSAPWNQKKAEEEQMDTDSTVARLSPVVSLPCLTTPEPEEKRRIKLFSETSSDEASPPKDAETDDDFVKVPREEYEAIKERMSAIEQRISQVSLQNVSPPKCEDVVVEYERTLQQTEPIAQSASTTNQLAKRLSRELKIRRSAEHKIIRSPSARKIGSIRRRSREGAAARISRQPTFDAELVKASTLRRGRPNTVQSGLRQATPIRKTVSAPATEETWYDADAFFADPNNDQHDLKSDFVEPPATPFLPPKAEDVFKTPASPALKRSARSITTKTPMLPPSAIPPARRPARTPIAGALKTPLLEPPKDIQTGRASIARIRIQNAGHVAAKAKLFDGLNQDAPKRPKRDSPSITPRRGAINKSPGINAARRHRLRQLQPSSPKATANGARLEPPTTPTTAYERHAIPRKKLLDRELQMRESPENRPLPGPMKRPLVTVKSPRRLVHKTPIKDRVATPLRAGPAFRHSPRLTLRR